MNGRRLTHRWILPVALVGLLIGHAVMLYYGARYTDLPVAVGAGLVVLIVIKHLGLLAPLFALLRRHFRRDAS